LHGWSENIACTFADGDRKHWSAFRPLAALGRCGNIFLFACHRSLLASLGDIVIANIGHRLAARSARRYRDRKHWSPFRPRFARRYRDREHWSPFGPRFASAQNDKLTCAGGGPYPQRMLVEICIDSFDSFDSQLSSFSLSLASLK
jgi:hypothetical protein